MAVSTTIDVSREGYLHKLGAANPAWRKRYFILSENILKYQKKESSSKEKGKVPLPEARGIREKRQCWSKVSWPKKVSDDCCFAVSTKKRTYYFYADTADDARTWKSELKKVINAISTELSDNWQKDPEGRPDSGGVKVAKGLTKFTASATKVVAQSGVVPDEAAAVMEGAADLAENQADMDGSATIGDRLRVGAGDVIGTVGNCVDNEFVSAGADIVKGQLQADKDASVSQRLALGVGSGLKGVGGAVDNPIASGVLKTAGGVVSDQASMDPDASAEDRILTGVGSIASGVADNVDNDQAKDIAKGVQGGAKLAKGGIKMGKSIAKMKKKK